MLSTVQSNLTPRLTASLGNSTGWQSKTGDRCHLWLTRSFEIIVPKNGARDSRLRQILEDRKHLRAATVILLAESDIGDRVRVLGPQAPFVPHDLDPTAVLNIIETARNMSARQAASFLEREFRRLAESVLPGIRVKELLTPHYLRTRMRQRPRDMQRLQSVTENLGRIGPTHSWRTLFNQLGYKTEQLPKRGYLLRHNETPVAVIHPMQDPEEFSRMNENGELPDGLVLKDCLTTGANWGILASGLRFRLFQTNPTSGSATARWIEIDARELNQNDKPYLGLIAPESLKTGGWLTEWAADARDFGEELRQGLEERLRSVALPKLAQGIGTYLELTKGIDLENRDSLQEIEEAVLTFVFRFMFVLHVEARGYLPVESPAYNPQSATKIAQDCLLEEQELSAKSTQRWDRIRTLVRMVRSGDRSVGVPHYNGSLFAPDRFPGAKLLEEVELPDACLAPAIRAIAYDIEKSPAGLDYAGLQVGHLGAIYEALLALRLTRAREDLKYDTSSEVFRPIRVGETAEIAASKLFYQTEKGERKAGGVFYTREEFVRHLLNHSLVPALDEHLERIGELARKDPKNAARALFDFSIVDPAMGSGHFLTTALDMMADRIELFLADIGGLPAIRKQLDELRDGQDTDLATVEDVDLLRRLILKRCIYGVDISPMAVEVANVTLWLSSFVPGLALSYLGSNLKCGDALVGVADPNKVGQSDSPFFTGQFVGRAMKKAADLQRTLGQVSDITPEDVERSQKLDDQIQETTIGLRNAFNLWTADRLGLEQARYQLETHAPKILNHTPQPDPSLEHFIVAAKELALHYRFLHWTLEFPHVFHAEHPGFDVVVGNPPWKEVTIEELKFYALRDPGLHGIQNLTDRRNRILELDLQFPSYRRQFESRRDILKSMREFFKSSGEYKLQGKGDTDLYQLFCERYSDLVCSNGRLGVVLPRTAFLVEGADKFREWLFKANTVRRIDIVLNNRKWAFPIHSQYNVALLSAHNRTSSGDDFFSIAGPLRSLNEFEETKNANVVTINCDALAKPYILPLLSSQRHSDLLTKLAKHPRFDEHTFRSVPYAELHETNDRSLFTLPKDQGDTPVWKGRCFNQYNPHGAGMAGLCLWEDTFTYLQKRRTRATKFKPLFDQDILEDADTHPINWFRIAFRGSSRSTDTRTIRACLVPPGIPLTNSAPYLIHTHRDALAQASVLGVMNSVGFDWIARRYVERSVGYFILEMLAFPPADNTPWHHIGKLAARLSCVDDRFADFAIATDIAWGPQTDFERNDMRAEIDALVFGAYDLTRDEVQFLFSDFTTRAFSPTYRQLVLEKFEAL